MQYHQQRRKKKRGRRSNKDIENDFKNLYYNFDQPSSYSGARKLYAATFKKYKPKKVLEWLEKQDAYTFHKPVRFRFPRRNYNIYNVADLWEIDLADMRKWKSYNDNYAYILLCIDVLSKFVFAEPLYDKTAQSVAAALERIFERSGNRLPLVIQGDKGNEFLGSSTQKVLKKWNIVYRKTKSDVKGSVIERLIRTVKERIWRYFTHRYTMRYLDVLEKIINSYNNTVHSATKMTPASVTWYNANVARENVKKRYKIKRKKRCKYAVGDHVRISQEKKVFGKGYEGGWSIEVYKIVRISQTRNPVVYYLEDLKQEPIDCFFYEEELSKVRKIENFEIEKILSARGKGKKKEVLVKWLGYPEKFNSWIKANEVIDL